MKTCNHTGWCACTKHRSNVGAEHLGHQPQNEESRVLRVPPADGRDSETDRAGEQRGMDTAYNGDNDNGERGYGATEEDSILVFE